MDFVIENARQIAEKLSQMRERDEMDYFYAYFVEEYPEEAEELSSELAFWFAEDGDLLGKAVLDDVANVLSGPRDSAGGYRSGIRR